MLSLSILGMGTLVEGGLLANFKSTLVRPRESIAEIQPPTPSDFADLVSGYFPVFHARDFLSFPVHTAMTK